MFANSSIREAPNDRDDVCAFHIVGEVSRTDMEEMAQFMDAQFKAHDKVSMLLIFDHYNGAETGASMNWEVIKTRFKSLSKVDKYAVLNAPESAAHMVETKGSVIPVDARAFDDAAEAWAFVGATPKDSDPVA